MRNQEASQWEEVREDLKDLWNLRQGQRNWSCVLIRCCQEEKIINRVVWYLNILFCVSVCPSLRTTKRAKSWNWLGSSSHSHQPGSGALWWFPWFGQGSCLVCDQTWLWRAWFGSGGITVTAYLCLMLMSCEIAHAQWDSPKALLRMPGQLSAVGDVFLFLTQNAFPDISFCPPHAWSCAWGDQRGNKRSHLPREALMRATGTGLSIAEGIFSVQELWFAKS